MAEGDASAVAERERLRLQAITASGLTPDLGAADSRPGVLDDIAELTARLLGVSAALVTVVDAEEQWYLGRAGTDVEILPREQAFCDLAIRQPDRAMVVPDAREHPVLASYPLVQVEDGIRFYAGMPVTLPGGEAVGTVCAFDTVPRVPDDRALDSLRRMARLVEHELASLALNHQLGQLSQDASDRADREHSVLRGILDNLTDAILACDPDGRLTVFNPASQLAHGVIGDVLLPDGTVPDSWRDRCRVLAPDGITRLAEDEQPLMRALSGEHVRGQEIVLVPEEGPRRRLRCNGQQIRSSSGELLGAVVAMTDITESRAVQERLEYMATHDQLTGLLSRGQVDAAVNDLLAAHPEEAMAVAYVDLNHFKEVNDHLGHLAGDEVLAAVARRLTEATPPGAVRARMGGDEFLAVWSVPPGADPEELQNALAWDLDGPVPLPGADVTLSVAVGVLVIPPGAPADLRSWIHEADGAMYADKRGPGRRAEDPPPSG